jgi:hypothetical protein
MVEIGATHLAKRVYIPIGNMIRDVFQNYEARSTAGDMIWKTMRSDTSADGEARALFTLAARSLAQDENSSVLVQAGNVEENDDDGLVHLRCVVAPNSIDHITGEVDGGSVYSFTVNADGDVVTSVSGDITMDVSGDVTITVDGDGELTFSNLTQTINGDMTTEVSGSHTLEASSSTEDISGVKKVLCSCIKLGGDGARTPVVLATESVIAFMAGHTHTVVGATTGVPTSPVTPPQMQATKVYGE